MKIDQFQNEYRFLSNFYPALVEYEGLRYPTSEHAFVAAKTTDKQNRFAIQALPSPGLAKRFGRSLVLRPGWDDMRLGVMLEIVRTKFRDNLQLRADLIGTRDAELIEGNTWGDTFWGVCRGIGENNLGKILMQVRKEFADATGGQ